VVEHEAHGGGGEGLGLAADGAGHVKDVHGRVQSNHAHQRAHTVLPHLAVGAHRISMILSPDEVKALKRFIRDVIIMLNITLVLLLRVLNITLVLLLRVLMITNPPSSRTMRLNHSLTSGMFTECSLNVH
jgi:hypothetical protein